MSPLPSRSAAAGVDGLNWKLHPHTIDQEDFFTDVTTLRRLFADLIGAESARAVVIPSVSYGVASCVRNLHLEPGTNVVLTGEEFPSNSLPWRRLASDSSATIKVVERPNSDDSWSQHVLEAIDPATRVVALAHVHWTDGTRFDLEAIAARARDVDAALIIDGSQSVGALPFDVKVIRPDALICPGYKWMMGPYSIGVAYYSPRFDGGRPIEENWFAREGSDDFSQLMNVGDYQPGALRYEVGETADFAAVPTMLASLRYLRELGPARIQEYAKELTREPLQRIEQLGVEIEPAASRAHHLIGLRLPSRLDPASVMAAVKQRGIYLSVRGTVLRVSTNVWNNSDDLDALAEALEEVIG